MKGSSILAILVLFVLCSAEAQVPVKRLATPDLCGPLLTSDEIAQNEAARNPLQRLTGLLGTTQISILWNTAGAGRPMNLHEQTQYLTSVQVTDRQGRTFAVEAYRVRRGPIEPTADPFGDRNTFRGDLRWSIQALGEPLAAAIGMEWLRGDGEFDLVLAADGDEMSRRQTVLNRYLPGDSKLGVLIKSVKGRIPSEAFLRVIGEREFPVTVSHESSDVDRKHDLSYHLPVILADQRIADWASWFNSRYFAWVDTVARFVVAKGRGIKLAEVTTEQIAHAKVQARTDHSYIFWREGYLASLISEASLDRTGGVFDEFLGGMGLAILDGQKTLELFPRTVLFRPNRDTAEIDTETSITNLMLVQILSKFSIDHSSGDILTALAGTLRFGSATERYAKESAPIKQLLAEFNLDPANRPPSHLISYELMQSGLAEDVVRKTLARKKHVNSIAERLLNNE